MVMSFILRLYLFLAQALVLVFVKKSRIMLFKQARYEEIHPNELKTAHFHYSYHLFCTILIIHLKTCAKPGCLAPSFAVYI